MAAPHVNGVVAHDGTSSAFLQHIFSYPVVSEGVSTFKSYELGQRSINLGDSAYKTFAAPFVSYLAKPYEYVSPYVQRVDSLGDKTLNRIDESFPVVKKSSSEIYSDTRGLVLLPYNKGVEGRDHVFQVFSTECKKSDQQSLVGQGKAAVTTVFVVSNEALSWASTFLTNKKAETTKAVKEKVNQ